MLAPDQRPPAALEVLHEPFAAASFLRRRKEQIPRCDRPVSSTSSSSARNGSASVRVLPGIFLHLRADIACLLCLPSGRCNRPEAAATRLRDPPDVRDQSSPASAFQVFPFSHACLHPLASWRHRIFLFL